MRMSPGQTCTGKLPGRDQQALVLDGPAEVGVTDGPVLEQVHWSLQLVFEGLDQLEVRAAMFQGRYPIKAHHEVKVVWRVGTPSGAAREFEPGDARLCRESLQALKLIGVQGSHHRHSLLADLLPCKRGTGLGPVSRLTPTSALAAQTVSMTTPKPESLQHEAGRVQETKTPADNPVRLPETPAPSGAALLMQATREAVDEHHEMFRRIAES